MKPNLYLRASLALLAAVVVVVGAVAAGAQTLSRTEPIASIEQPVQLRADTTPAVGQLDAATLGADSTAQATLLQAEADRVAVEQAYFEKLEAEAAYFEAVQEQAYFAQLEREAAEAAAAEEAAAAAALRPSGVPDDSYWDRMAACETGGNWAMSGSRFSGGVGFANTTWNAWGGREFAGNAGSATREQQIVVANRVATQGYGNVAPVGYSGWGCAKHSVGYP